MRLRRACLAVAFLLAGAPAAAHGTPARDPLLTARLLRLADSPALPEQVRAAWEAAILYQFEDSIFAPLGDYDLDGVTDVVQWRISFDGRLGGDDVIDARSGKDGSLLWSYDPPDVPASIAGFHLLYPAKVGPQGRDGVVMLEVEAREALVTGTAYAIDNTGAQAWYYTAPQVFPVTVLDALPGKASDVLLVAYADSARPLLIDGSNGRLVQAAGSSVDAYDVMALPDVSGDKLDDYAVADGDTVRAYSTASPDPVWSRPWARHDATVAAGLGDLTGDRRHETGLVGYDVTAQGGIVTSPTAVVDGATGRQLWSRSARLRPFGNVGGDRRAEVMATTSGNGTMTVEALDAAGRRLWRARPPSPGRGSTSTVAYPIDDVQGDGVPDVQWKICLWKKTLVVSGGWIDGRTGRVHSTPVGFTGSVGAVDGAGTDFARATATSDVLTVDVWNGRTGALLWRTKVTLPNTKMFAYFPNAATVVKDRCGDVAVSAWGNETYYVVLFDGATGRPTLALRATDREQAEAVTPVVRSRTDRNRCG